MKVLLQLLIPGICLGCVYGLNGIGSALLYKGSKTINNAQGAITGLGALIGYKIQQLLGLGLISSTLIATVITFFIGILLQMSIVSQVEKRAPINIVIATLALDLIISSGNNIIFGTYVYESAVVYINGSKYLHIDFINVDILWSNIIAIILSLIAMIAIHVFLNKTEFGLSMRAAAMDEIAAESCGINTVKTKAVTWGIMSALGCLGGCLSGPLFGVTVFIGRAIGRKGNTGAVLGGYGNMYGAIIGGIVVGIVETFFGYMWSQYQQAFTSLLFLVFILFMPHGITNEKAIEEG